MRATKPLIERFWAKVDVDVIGQGCWLWRGAKNNKGYGYIRIGHRDEGMVTAHGYSYQLAKGPYDSSLHIDHLCRNPNCVNPAHLEPVPPAENTRRGKLSALYCVNGHRFSAENTGLYAHVRYCRSCKHARWANWYHDRGGREHRAAQRAA